MKLYLSYATVGRYGSLDLPGRLRYFDRYIQQEIDQSNFKSLIQEYWITFAFPPPYVLPNRIKNIDSFWEWYAGLPYYRINRKLKKIDITVQASEFSEYFVPQTQTNDQHQFFLAKADQEMDEIRLAKILMDKLVMALAWIDSKTRPSDSFNGAAIIELFGRIKSEMTADLLVKISKRETVEVMDEALRQALSHRTDRRENPKDKNKAIRDLRVYYVDLPIKALYPYDYQYSEIFLNLLSSKGIQCPDYHHLYIAVGRSEEAVLKKSIPIASWHVYGITTIDYKRYLSQTSEEQEKIVFDLICAGLLDIAEIDGLDLSLIKQVIDEVKERGLDTELVYKKVEHKNYTLTITYLARSREEGCPIFFWIKDKATDKKYLKQIGLADKSQIYLWLQKIRLTRKQIKIWSSTSAHGDVWLKDKERALVLDLAEIMVPEYEV